MTASTDYNFKVGVTEDLATRIIRQLAVGDLRAIIAQQDYLIENHKYLETP
jgi:hypothetical protein